MTTLNITEFLAKHGIPYYQWPKDEFSSLQIEASKIIGGTATLIVKDGKVIRTQTIVDTMIFHTDAAGVSYALHHAGHISPAGRKQLRKHNGCLTTLLLRGEQIEAASKRSIRRELGLNIDGKAKIEIDYKPLESATIYELGQYKGLYAQDFRFVVVCRIDTELYQPEGYQCDDCTGVSHYKWAEANAFRA